jgi:hypothetical protein
MDIDPDTDINTDITYCSHDVDIDILYVDIHMDMEWTLSWA